MMKIIDRLCGMRWRVIVIIFLAGLVMRSGILFSPHMEGDERIYVTLVDQLLHGKGYTLQGSQLLEQGEIDQFQYDRPLFFHPPGGVALFWLFYTVFGIWGFALVQMFSYALFFWSMLLLAKSLYPSLSNMGLVFVAVLSAFNPIMAHVTTNYWLDGPLLAITTLAMAIYVRAVAQKKLRLAVLSGLLLGAASLIKITAFLVIPGATLITWYLLKPDDTVRYMALFLAAAVVVQMPWEVWQWVVLGSPFPGWAGKPSESLILSNPYIYFLTVVRSPWIYFTHIPGVLSTSVSCLFLTFLMWADRNLRSLSISLLVWVLTVVVFHVLLGCMGYSKVLRYTILISPALICLFSILFSEYISSIRYKGASTFTKLMVVTALLSVALEVYSGVKASLLLDSDLIVPLLCRCF